MKNIINLPMMAHPVNWITMLVWLLLIGVIIHIFHARLVCSYPPKTKVNS